MFELWKTLVIALGKQGLVDLEKALDDYRPIDGLGL
jgi:hypothetical protein